MALEGNSRALPHDELANRLVLVIDADPSFTEQARQLLPEERVLTARSLDETAEVVTGGWVDLAVLGPSFGNEAGVGEAARLRRYDPGLAVVLVANIVTNQILLAALRVGMTDVVGMPLTHRKIAALLNRARSNGVPTEPTGGFAEVSSPVEPERVAQPGRGSALPAAAPAWQAPPDGGGRPAAPAAPPSGLPPRPAEPPPVPIVPGEGEAGRPWGDAAPSFQPPAQARGPAGRVIAVMAGKGGSGKTVIATNLAVALALQRGEAEVVIVDADLPFGDVALLLNLDPVHTISKAATLIDELSDVRLEAMLIRHESGLHVLPAPLLPRLDESIPAKAIVELVERLRGMYEFVVIDTPTVFDDHLVTILEYADDVLIVVDMDLPSLKNAKIGLSALRSDRFPMERIHLVINRANSKARLDVSELERTLGLPVAASIPSDRLVPQSVNEGIPVVALSPRSKVARSFQGLAEQMADSERSGRRRR